MWEHFFDLSGLESDNPVRCHVRLLVRSRRFSFYSDQIFSALDVKNVGLIELSISDIVQKISQWIPEVCDPVHMTSS